MRTIIPTLFLVEFFSFGNFIPWDQETPFASWGLLSCTYYLAVWCILELKNIQKEETVGFWDHIV